MCARLFNAGDLGLIPGSRRSLGEGNGNALQYSCLENPMDGGAWWATVHSVAKSWTQLSDFTFYGVEMKTDLFPVSFNLFNRVELDSHSRSSRGL